MLFPESWYKYIPEGFEVMGIDGVKEYFQPGKTEDDSRFGMLAYGIEV